MEKNIPIVCDLDGTLIKSDLYLESLVIFIKKNYFFILNIFYQILFNKISFKHKITQKIKLDANNIPINFELLDWLKKEQKSGRDVYLVTGATPDSFKCIKKSLINFKRIVTSSKKINLVGKNKANFLKEEFGINKFDYVGNSVSDFAIWKISRHKILANNVYLEYFFENYFSKIFFKPSNYIKELLYFLRVHQWSKNILIFVHPLLTQQLLNFDLMIKYFYFFITFSLLASAIYLFNDLLDLNDDRKHSHKSKRPLASGYFDIKETFLIICIVLITVLFLAIKLEVILLLILVGYVFLNIFYTLILKKIKYLDITILALFFNIRIFSGVLIDPDSLISKRFFVFCFFVFCCLASLKRMVELKPKNYQNSNARGYMYKDLNIIKMIGLFSALFSFIILYLSFNNLIIFDSMSFIEFLLASTLFYIWLTHLWFSGFIGKIPSDPVSFAVQDYKSYIILFCILIIVL